jgi:hypothetical protein
VLAAEEINGGLRANKAHTDELIQVTPVSIASHIAIKIATTNSSKRL